MYNIKGEEIDINIIKDFDKGYIHAVLLTFGEYKENYDNVDELDYEDNVLGVVHIYEWCDNEYAVFNKVEINNVSVNAYMKIQNDAHEVINNALENNRRGI